MIRNTEGDDTDALGRATAVAHWWPSVTNVSEYVVAAPGASAAANPSDDRAAAAERTVDAAALAVAPWMKRRRFTGRFGMTD